MPTNMDFAGGAFITVIKSFKNFPGKHIFYNPVKLPKKEQP